MLSEQNEIKSGSDINRMAPAIDANFNRACEAVRVIEDGLRFILQDRHLAQIAKQTRHRLAAWARQCGADRWVGSRDPQHDVGRHTQLPAEYERQDLNDILRANFARAGQSLRCLEEFSKTIDVDASQSIEQIRYDLYTLERACLVGLSSRLRMSSARLCVLLNAGPDEAEFQRVVQQLIEGGADAIQLREKSLDDRSLLERATLLVEICRDRDVLSIVNDRPDVAVASGADGVHLGQQDLPIAAARRLIGPDRMIGVSTHDLTQAQQAVIDGANYIGIGPVFRSATKHFAEWIGTDVLNSVAGEISLPAFAIGGIDETNLETVLATGMRRVAVRQAVLGDADRIVQQCRCLKDLLSRADDSLESTAVTS